MNLGFPIFILGVMISAFHWIGIIIAGAGLSLYGNSIKSKVMFGAFGGLLVWLAFVAYLSSEGIFEKAAQTGQLFALSIFFAVVIGGVSGLITAFKIDQR
ncbi:hypothetical protein [Geoglobus acetivorans]|uniref:Uncharacterized protein n=1 Tax=Geoglobus acetivorans TaxID=565033 RepID=A0A0A7GC34_GEOAI|nr:hypothetical protein GACE_0317 [Geoglobus acetivorans]